MIRNSSKYNEENYNQFDDSLNPYTVVERRPSQACIFEEVFETENPIDDLKSIGNPYAHHPNYTTPSQYFSHLNNHTNATNSIDNLLTSTDVIQMSDPFSYYSPDVHSANVNAPNHVTLNKYVLSAESIEDLTRLNVQFPYKGAPPIAFSATHSRSTETLNKKMMTPGSMYELEKIDFDFEEKYNLETNLLKIRDFSAQSLADLRDLKNLSQYSNFNDCRDYETSIEIGQV